MAEVVAVLAGWFLLAVVTAFAVGPVLRHANDSVGPASPYDGERRLPQDHEVHSR
jgi:hypothetical protein